MPQDSDGKYVPRAPRFAVTNSNETIVKVTRTEGAEHETFTATLVDVSQHGTKLQVPVNFRFEEALQLHIEVVGTDLEYQGVASVRHIRSVDDKDGEERWVVGCAIAPALSDETFAYLATTAGKERRRFRRLPIAAEATVRRQAETEGCAAKLHNLSSGGFCFSSQVQFEVGEVVQLSILDNEGEQRLIESQICWQVENTEGSIAGCQFSSRDSYAELCACLTEQPTPPPSTQQSGEPTSKLVLTAAVLAMFVPPMMTLMMQANKVSAKSNSPTTFVKPEAETNGDASDEISVPCEKAELASTETSEAPTEGELLLLDSQPAPPQALREWADNTGKHRTQAKLVDATDEYVVLESSSGRHVNVPWRRLSSADQEYVRDWQASSN